MVTKPVPEVDAVQTEVPIDANECQNEPDAFQEEATSAEDIPRRRWKLLCVLFMLSTLAQSFKPSGSFLPRYLTEIKKLSLREQNHYVFPIRAYSTFGFMVPMIVLAEFVIGYKWALFIGVTARLFEQVLLFYGNGLVEVCISQGLRGLASTTRTVHGAFLYLIVPSSAYQFTTGWKRAANLFGQVSEGIVSNLIVNFAANPFTAVFMITQVSVFVGAVLMVVLFLVMSVGGNRQQPKNTTGHLSNSPSKLSLSRLRGIYSSPKVLLWSFWWWTAYAIIELSRDMSFPLFSTFGDDKATHNGYVSALIGVFAVLGALVAGRSNFIRKNNMTVVLTGLLVSGSFLAVAAVAPNVLVCYAMIVLVAFVFEVETVAAYSIIAVEIPESIRGLVLFYNTVVSLGVQSTIQALTSTFGLTINQKFIVFGSLLYLLAAVIVCCRVLRLSTTTDKRDP
ncbi:Major facilitator superfamily (MFS) profile domain-containing protein [Plasmodiophora brassicae]